MKVAQLELIAQGVIRNQHQYELMQYCSYQIYLTILWPHLFKEVSGSDQ